ncbi:MAG: WecB/TagA/CpsF family glycosyltransferase [Steroidobacteraceae bacterium]
MLGYDLTTQSLSQCVDEIVTHISSSRRASWLACLNPHSYAVACQDARFRQSLRSADWLIPDGVGIVLASMIMRGTIRQRITGADIFMTLHARLNDLGGKSVFFLGASEATLADIRVRMAEQFPNVRVAGTYSPPFKANYTEAELQDMAMAINASGADVLWVGMTAPKQEKWIMDNLPALNVRFAGAIGAVFDFFTGRVPRSSPLFQKLGLEWLPRLMRQPRRLWRRTFVSAPVFLSHVLVAAVRGR